MAAGTIAVNRSRKSRGSTDNYKYAMENMIKHVCYLECDVPGSSLIASVQLGIRISLVRLTVLFEVGVLMPPHHGAG
ncbi:hypothetical protein AJ87_24185 [Rhizobium yanglingense]|nr:hypothetical protein AJ87_24185 [Rhizobium yanglingense]